LEPNRPAIEATALTKYYGESRGIIDLNLTVQRGEIFGFLGPNGAGKTTTIRLFLSFISPSSGSVFLLGRESKKGDKELLAKIGYLSGETGFYQDFNGLEYLRHLMRLRGLYKKEMCLERTERLLNRFKIDLQRKIKSYSTGTKQMVAIIQAFMHGPELLILDEPTRGLDPLMQEQFHDLLSEEKSRGTTIFLSSHNLSEVKKVCDRVGVINEGKLILADDIDSYRAIVGKKVSIVTNGQTRDLSAALNQMDGLEHLTRKGNKLEFFYKGSMQILIKRITDFQIEDLTCETPSLEDAFLRHYEGLGND
jgi:ABC-2 type transport system ATP-binding protein